MSKIIGEPLLEPNESRFVLYPIKYNDMFKLYKNGVATFWTVEEIMLSNDKKQWITLTDNERKFIKYVLAFFAGSDGIVMENLAERFSNEIQIPEARFFYAYQIFNESIHSETYSLLIDTYITDLEEKKYLLDAIHSIPCIEKKAKWAQKWIHDQSAFPMRLIAFAVVEGIFFSGSFCAIYWLKKRGLMPGLSFSNELISRDEGLHTQFAILLYTEYIRNKLDESVVHEIFKEAVAIEKEFIIDAIPCNLIGMNSALMSQYIDFVADRLLVQLGYNKIWNASNPFDFMELISLRPKSNFFELKVGEYAKNTTKPDNDTNVFNELDDNF